MAFTSSISPEHRANLRHLKAEFDATFDLVTDREDRSSPAYRAADACYRAWIAALDAVSIALLDDIDACEMTHTRAKASRQPDLMPEPALTGPTDVEYLLRGIDDIQSAAALIGATPAPLVGERKNTPKARAIGIISDDRVARHWHISLGVDRKV